MGMNTALISNIYGLFVLILSIAVVLWVWKSRKDAIKADLRCLVLRIARFFHMSSRP